MTDNGDFEPPGLGYEELRGRTKIRTIRERLTEREARTWFEGRAFLAAQRSVDKGAEHGEEEQQPGDGSGA